MTSNEEADWNKAHEVDSQTGRPTKELYTDNDPVTTIKGCGFKDRETAIRTLWLTSQPGSRHKRYWTIRAMRERARFHPHFKNSPKMQEAVVVFDDWLEYWNKKDNSKRFEDEVSQRQELIPTKANCHSQRYASSQSEQIQWLRKDVRDGLQAVKYGVTLLDKAAKFEMPAHILVALFGGPGIHGYGQHVCEQAESSNLPAFRCTCQFENRHRIEVGFLSDKSVDFNVEIKEDTKETVKLDVDMLNLGKKFPLQSFKLEWNGDKDQKQNSKIVRKRNSQSTLTSFFKKSIVKKSRVN